MAARWADRTASRCCFGEADGSRGTPAETVRSSSSTLARSSRKSSPGRAGPSRRRTSGPTVAPWHNSERVATANATKINSGRFGVSAGRVCAAATVIAPRIPANTTTKPSRGPSGWARK
ncbi:Uncharacterised protein [Mycobacteroides abscessus subsp. abscessus]|nr:Uncharacterised protein [Mycobacteroides abscessus subsp. abscessus]